MVPGGRRKLAHFSVVMMGKRSMAFLESDVEKYITSQKDVYTILSSNPTLGIYPREINQQKKKKLQSIKIYNIKEWK